MPPAHPSGRHTFCVMRRVLLVLPLFLALVVVAPAAPAHACSCAMLSSAQRVENADVVVRGTITGLDDPGGSGTGRLVTWEVAVAEVYRGVAAATTFVRSASDGAACGIEVQQGREYLLFARRVGGDLRAGLCDGTTPVSAALVAEVEHLTGPGSLPQGGARATATTPPGTPSNGTPSRGTPLAGSTPPDGSDAALPLGVGVGGAMVAAALGALWWRRWARSGGGDAGLARQAATPEAHRTVRRLLTRGGSSPGIRAGSWRAPAPAPGRRHPRPRRAPRACWPAGWWL